MRRALFALAFAVGIAASPVLAQQAMPDATAQNEPPPPPPPASELPPPVPRASSELPPPFPHFPKAKPREHDPNWRRAAHSRRSTTSHHHRTTAHHAKSHARPKAHRHATSHAGAKPRHPAHVYFSKRTTRQCHRMDYKQIMRYPNCRVMMRQDLAAAERKHKAAHRSSKHRHSSTKRHKTHHRRR